MLVDGEDVDAAGGQGLLSAVGHAVSLRDDSTLTRRDDMLPIGIDADTQHARIVMSTHTHKKKEGNQAEHEQQFVFNSNVQQHLPPSGDVRQNKKK